MAFRQMFPKSFLVFPRSSNLHFHHSSNAERTSAPKNTPKHLQKKSLNCWNSRPIETYFMSLHFLVISKNQPGNQQPALDSSFHSRSEGFQFYQLQPLRTDVYCNCRPCCPSGGGRLYGNGWMVLWMQQQTMTFHIHLSVLMSAEIPKTKDPK